MKKNKFKNKRILFIVATAILTCISIAIILINFKSNIVFFYSPSEINEANFLSKIGDDKIIRVGGMIKPNSVNKSDAMTTIFTITDYQGDLKIIHKGILPDLFREEQGVVAKGKYNFNDKIFMSDELLVKHDENYMPPEVAKDLKMKVVK
ncbi:MAG: cytochrome c maturation protein CcmE [Rickettsiales bacterium]